MDGFIFKNARPRVLYDAEALASLKVRAEKDGFIGEKLGDIIRAADELIGKPLPEKRPETQQTGNLLSGLGHTAGFAYNLTGDAKYAEKVRDALLLAVSEGGWAEREFILSHPFVDGSPFWQSELATAHAAGTAGECFDLVHDFLSESEREKIASGILEYGIKPLLEDWVLPDTRIHALDSMGHNWWAVCIAGAGVALMSIYEYVPQAAEWLELVTRALEEYISYPGAALLNKVPNFASDGVFFESTVYFDYGTSQLIRYFFVYGRLFEHGAERGQSELIDRAAEAYPNFFYPTTRAKYDSITFGFGDGDYDSFYGAFPLYMLLSGRGTPELLRIYRDYSKGYGDLDLVYWDKLSENIPEKHELPTEKVFFDGGYAILRASAEPDATLLAVRASFAWNHTHDDPGSFVIMDKGWPIICDSGKSPYSTYEYERYFKTPRAHNVVLINPNDWVIDRDPPLSIVRGSKFPGKIASFLSHGDVRYILADVAGATARYTDRNFRSFIALGDDMLVILDDLHAYEPVQYAFALHYCGSASLGKSSAEITRDDTVLSADFLFPKDVSLRETDGLVTVDNSSAPNSPPYWHSRYITAYAPPDSTTMHYLTVMRLNEAASGAAVERLEGLMWVGARVTRGGEVTNIYFNLLADGRKMHDNSNNIVAGYETDAYLLIERGGELIVIYGSYVRKDGKTLYSSFAKSDAAIAL